MSQVAKHLEFCKAKGSRHEVQFIANNPLHVSQLLLHPVQTLLIKLPKYFTGHYERQKLLYKKYPGLQEEH